MGLMLIKKKIRELSLYLSCESLEIQLNTSFFAPVIYDLREGPYFLAQLARAFEKLTKSPLVGKFQTRFFSQTR